MLAPLVVLLLLFAENISLTFLHVTAA